MKIIERKYLKSYEIEKACISLIHSQDKFLLGSFQLMGEQQTDDSMQKNLGVLSEEHYDGDHYGHSFNIFFFRFALGKTANISPID